MIPLPSAALSRREMLRMTVLFSAALGVGWRKSPALAAAPNEGKALNFLAFGDWGIASPEQFEVAGAMRRLAATQKMDALLLLGDNFYGRLEGTDDLRWLREFEECYPAKVFPGPCHALLGNHDYDDMKGKEAVELGYAAAHPGTRWSMPAKWYSFLSPAVEPLVEFVVVDSHFKGMTREEIAEQQGWLEGVLAKPCPARWRMVLGHHPIFSNGTHGDTKEVKKAWSDLFARSGVHFYVCGHDHDLQHLQIEGHPTHFLVSGGGGAPLHGLQRKDRGPFGQTAFGFLHWRITAEAVESRFHDQKGDLIYKFRV